MAIIDKIQLSGTVYTIGNETTTAVTSASTDNEIPTAKAVYDAIPQGGGGKAISAGTNISITTGETADTINCTLPIKTNAWKSLTFNSRQEPPKVLYTSAFGDYTTASGEASFSIGKDTTASGNYSFVGGNKSKAIGESSFAFGDEVIVNSQTSAAFGRYITTKNIYEFGCGILNNSLNGSSSDSGNTLFSVGNGNYGERHNAFEIRQNGDIYIADTNDTSTTNYYEKPMIKLQDALGGGGGSITIDTSLDSGSTNAVANSAITNAINSKMDEVNFASFYGNQYSAGLKGYYYDSQTETQTEKFNWGMVWQSDGSIGFDALGNLAVFNKIDTSAITTSITSESTDAQVPSAKAVYDAISKGGSGGGKAIKAGRGISIATGDTADTVSLNLPISAGTKTNALIYNSTMNAASGDYSNAEGYNTTAIGSYSHAEGFIANAKGIASHAEGLSTKSKGFGSHAEGRETEASGDYSHSEGYLTRTTNESEHSSGRYNNSVSASTTFGDSGNTLFSVGNGTADNARHNAFEIRQNGDIYISKDGQDVKLQDQLGGGGSTYTAGDGIDITNDVISVTGKVDTSAITTTITSSSTDAQVPSAKAVYDMVGNINTILESI